MLHNPTYKISCFFNVFRNNLVFHFKFVDFGMRADNKFLFCRIHLFFPDF